MTMRLGLASLALALLAACGLYLLKDQVQRREGELRRVQSAVSAERIEIGRLRAEWAMLNPYMMLFRIQEQGWTEEKALEEAIRLGLPRDEMRKFARSYLSPRSGK
jgi:hypothetical protein